MADNNHTPEELRAVLSQSVETLAVQLVMGDDSGGDSATGSVVAALREIGEQARAAGFPEMAETASGLLEAISGQRTQPLEEILNEGIRRLQESLETERLEEPAAPSPPQASEAATEPARAAPPASLSQDPELLSDFILESKDHLATIESQLLVIEQNPRNLEPLHSVFRGFHTIKGLAGFLELTAIKEVAHEVETVLDRARNGDLAITPEVIDVVLQGGDYLKAAIQGVEAELGGQGPAVAADNQRLIERVRGLLSATPEQAYSPEPELETAPEAAESPAGQPSPEQGAAPAAVKSAARSVKVDTEKLDHLVDMVGEMVIAQSLLRHDPDLAAIRTPRLQRNLSQLARITTDVQRTAMSMRMVPVGNLFQRMLRLVRDLSRKAGKRVEMAISGEDTELDRNIVEELADPLMHMVRNAVDHGLESSEERAAAGKPAAGQVVLKACHQSGLIVIELSDDGRGLNREKILQKAREKGLVDASSQLSDNEVFNLIFEPGFSTAAQVTEVSGRGVGMDVVKKNITKMRGRVDIQSAAGKGTTFLLKLPLTLAIIDGLVIGVGKERYIVPISSVREMLRPAAEALSTVQNRAEMVQVRESLLPLVRLHRCFDIQPRSTDPTEGLLIVAETVGKRFCLLVDEFIGKQEVVIKSLGEALKNIPGLAGGAILGDGHVGLILDMDGIFGGRTDA